MISLDFIFSVPSIRSSGRFFDRTPRLHLNSLPNLCPFHSLVAVVPGSSPCGRVIYSDI